HLPLTERFLTERFRKLAEMASSCQGCGTGRRVIENARGDVPLGLNKDRTTRGRLPRRYGHWGIKPRLGRYSPTPSKNTLSRRNGSSLPQLGHQLHVHVRRR